jgi:hypothetical protein
MIKANLAAEFGNVFVLTIGAEFRVIQTIDKDDLIERRYLFF